MNWLAKINLKTVANRLGAFRASLLLLTLIILCLYIGYRMGNFYHSYQTQTMENQQQRLAYLYTQQSDQVKRINTIEVELAVERLANQQSKITLKNMEKEHYQLKKQIGFYEKVMSPEKEADGFAIDGLILYPTQSPNHYRFELTLVQKQLKKNFVSGHVQLSFAGSLDKKPTELTLSKVSDITKKDLSFSFKYFQIIEGEFTFPSHFIPENVSISAVLPKNRWQKYHRLDNKYLWREIIKNP